MLHVSHGREPMTVVRATLVERTPREPGQSTVELALAAVLLITLALAGTDVARGLVQYSRMVSAANAGAQYGSYSGTNSQNTSGIVSQAQIELGSIPGSNVQVTVADDGTGEALQKVTVAVSAPFHPVAPFIEGLFDTTFTTTATMRVNPFN